MTEPPARVVPVPAEVGSIERNNHEVADPHLDVLIAARAEVTLRGLERVDDADLDLVLTR